jgi:hypothetical protein
LVTVTRDAERVLLDASVIVNFADGGALIPLTQYLGPRAAITLDVERELNRLAGSSKPALLNLGRLRWPSGEALALPSDLLADAEALRKLNAPADAHELSNAGEISTALLGARLEDTVVIIDDAFGKRLCQTRNVRRLSTAQLVAEMVAASSLDVDAGYIVFDIATPSDVGRPEFTQAVERARTALS